MSQLYYIDAYNVIHHSRQLQDLANANLEGAREALLELVANFCSATGERARVVFDGAGEQRLAARAKSALAPGLEVIYATARSSADAYIERSVYQAQDRRKVIVVTGDRGIRDLCIGMGAMVMTPESFLETARGHGQQTAEAITRMHLNQRITAIEDRLKTDALERLLKLRDKLDK